MQPKRVCFPYVGDTLGGSHISSLLLAANLPPERYQAAIVIHQKGILSEYLDDLGHPYDLLPLPTLVRSGGLAKPIADVWRLRPLIRDFLNRSRISLVHGNDGRINQTWVLPTRLARRPYVWHQRARFDGSRLRRLLAGASSDILCVSQFALGRLPTHALRERAAVIANPFDTSAPAPDRSTARQQVIAASGAPAGGLIVGFCGSLTEQKRPDVFLEVAAHLQKQVMAPVTYVLMGTDRDNLWPDLQNRASALGLDGQVSFIGFRKPAEFWIAGFDVLLATQVEDAFPRIFVEAMLAGTPIVASQSGGHGEILESGVTGYLVPAHSAEDFATTTLALLNDRNLRDRIAGTARKAALERFSVARHVDAVTTRYDALTA
jgi:glycosyltransferase involved in cell wall biosynthesis